MNFFEYTMYSEKSISGNDVHYCSQKKRKMAWMRETRIRTFMQLELKACLDEIDWMIRSHMYSANNYSEEEYPS